jgi:hypothetical protein
VERCPRCQASSVTAATLADRFVYLRCAACAHVWARPERRRLPRPLPSRNQAHEDAPGQPGRQQR